MVSLAAVGNGCPDALVGRGGRTFLLEFKTPRGAKRKGETADRQAQWAARWRGDPPVVVTNAMQALAAVGATALNATDDEVRAWKESRCQCGRG